MKYCSNCGNELKEGADICLNCGILINKNQKVRRKTNKSKVFLVLINVFSFVSKVFLTLSVFFIALAIVYSEPGCNLSFCYLAFDYVFSIIAIIYSWIAFVIAIPLFILKLIKTRKTINIYNEILYMLFAMGAIIVSMLLIL